jgi:hypothetical protein
VPSFDAGEAPRRSTSSLGIHLLRLGFFPNFKGSDAVLLAADTDGVRALLDAISSAAANPGDSVPVHDIAQVSVKYPALLYVAATRKRIHSAPAHTYYLDVSGSARLNVEGLLEPLLTATSGHQYFDLVPKHITLVVSVGEYDSPWWARLDT